MGNMRLLARVNTVLFFLLLLQGLTAALVGMMNLKVFAVIHPLGGMFLIVFGFIHLALNRQWVRSAYFGKRRKMSG